MNGHFVISLDFELHWGMCDHKSVEDYQENLKNVGPVINRLLTLADDYNIKLTFATVGFLFARNKSELLEFVPSNKPTYTDPKLSPYPLLNSIENEKEDPYHFAKSAIKQIQVNGNHEIGTHTFSHYYCHEPGQTVSQFEEDIKSAVAIAKPLDIKLESIVFPRNMIKADNKIDQPYLEVCKKHGINSFRGKEKAFIYNIHTTKFYKGWYIFKFLRLLYTYINVTGYNTYNVDKYYSDKSILNLPSSRILRAYIKPLKFLEPLKVLRIKKSMKH
ncbi:MAG: polysaccharide deacetylase, partial [Bacteroidetes bacterium]